MRLEFSSRLQPLAILIFLIAGCNSEDPTKSTSTTDTSTNQSGMARYTPFDASGSVTKISPDLYEQLANILNVRVVPGNYKPGDSSITHAHPDFAHLCIKSK